MAELPPARLWVDRPVLSDELRLCATAFDGARLLLSDEGHATGAPPDGFDAVFTAPLAQPAALAGVARTLAQRYDIDAVLGLTEISVIAAATLAERLGVRGIGVETAWCCRDKARMANALAAAAVPTPATCTLADDDDPAALVRRLGGFPVIVKPRLGLASCGVIRADTPGMLEQAIRRCRHINRFVLRRYLPSRPGRESVILQRFVQGRELALDGYVQNGQSHIVVVVDKPDVSNGPYFDDRIHVLPATLTSEESRLLQQTAASTVAALGLDNSLFHLEVRLQGDSVHVLELGARIAFVSSTYDALGIDMRQVATQLAIGQPVRCEARRQRHAGMLVVSAQRNGRFAGVVNRDALCEHDAINGVMAVARPGERVAPSPEATNNVAYVSAVAASEPEVLDALRWAADNIEIVIE